MIDLRLRKTLDEASKENAAANLAEQKASAHADRACHSLCVPESVMVVSSPPSRTGFCHLPADAV